MAINRLGRDEILIRALDRADSAVLDAKDRPSATIIAGALSIGWLQEGIDYFYKKFPWGGTITSSTINIAENDTQITLPSDFILDYIDGIILPEDKGILRRKSLLVVIQQPVGTTATPNRGTPAIYTVAGGVIEFRPKADKAYTGASLWYYALPAALTALVVPTFPDDSILVEYVWIKAMEWHRKLTIGSSFEYANKQIAELQKSGIGIEAEMDKIPFDKDAFGERELSSRVDWMGRVIS